MGRMVEGQEAHLQETELKNRTLRGADSGSAGLGGFSWTRAFPARAGLMSKMEQPWMTSKGTVCHGM